MSRIVRGWENPYSSQHMQERAAQNYRKVQQRKAERRFEAQLSQNGPLEDLDLIKDQLALEDRTVEVQERFHRHKTLRPTVRHPLSYRAVQSIASGARAVEPTQGGATIWTAENDGTISIRSGQCGTVVVTIPARGDDATVDVLHATETHMWAGLSDGTVIVYDHLVFVQVTEGMFHTAGITCFAQTADGRMFSASEDGSLIKWDTESRNFEAITRFVPQDHGPITAMAASGTTLFCGGHGGRLIAIDADAGDLLLTFEGHQGVVGAITVADGYLFTASSDSTVRIWNPSSGTVLKVTAANAPVTAMVPDPVTHRVWLAMTSGVMEVWRTRPDDNFACERQITIYEGRPLLSLKGIEAVDTLKVWTLASDGLNKVWCSSHNRVVQHMRDAVEALRAVILQDTTELDRWRQLVERLQHIQQRRRQQLALSLQTYHRDLLLRRFMWTLSRYAKRQHEHRRRQAVCDRLCLESTTTLFRCYFSKWFAWYRTSQTTTLKRKFALISANMQQETTAMITAQKLFFASRLDRTVTLRRSIVDTLCQQTSLFLMRLYYRKWSRYLADRQRRQHSKRQAEILRRCNEMLLLRQSYCAWQNLRVNRLDIRLREQYAGSLATVNSRLHMQLVWIRWQNYRRRRQALAAKMQVMTLFRSYVEAQQRRSAFETWKLFVSSSRRRRVEKDNSQLRQHLTMLRERYSDLVTLLEEKKRLTALRAKSVQQEEELQDIQQRITELERQRAVILDAAAQRRLEGDAMTVQQRLIHVMSQLKAFVLNYYADGPLFHQVRDRIRGGQGVAKVFLEAHQVVKRAVVDVTRNPHLSAYERWPLTPTLLNRIPPHSHNPILTAIKTMVITFDIFEQKDHDSLTSNEEIVLNADWLMSMASICLESKKKSSSIVRR